MPFPNFEGKHAHDALFTPQDLIAYRQKQGRLLDFSPPKGVILCYQSSLLTYILEVEEVERQKVGPGDFYLLKRTGNRVGVYGGFGIGAPVAAVVLEDLIALGTTEFINIGTAGGLQKPQQIGDIVVCSQAIRDEGVSYHYRAPAPHAQPAAVLTDRLKEALTRAAVPYTEGPTWTIDTPYRETVAEARHYQREGVQTVEMEAAAVFAVAEYRQVAAAAAFAISDSLAELVWDPQFGSPDLKRSLERLYQAAVAALMGGEPTGPVEEAER